MPMHEIDQVIAAARDVGAGPVVLDLVAASFEGVAEGCDQAARAFPELTISFADIARMLRNVSSGYGQAAAEMRKGGPS